MVRKDDEHRAEVQRRRQRRAERSAHTAEVGPEPRYTGPRKTTTDVAKVKAAKDKRDRRALRRLKDLGREIG